MLLLAVTGVGLAVATRHVWFYIDEWTFIVQRTGPHPLVGVMAPHNAHPSIVPVLVWRAMWSLVGLRSYLPYLIPLFALHLLDVTLVWLLSRRSGAGPWSCLAVAAVAAVGGVGAADVTWAFQIGFLGSVAGTLGATLLIERGAFGRLPVGPWVLLILSASCSLMAVPLAVLPFLTTWSRGGLRAAVRVVSVPALLLVGYVALYDHSLVAGSDGGAALASVSTFAVAGIGSALAAVTGVPGTAVVALVVVLVALRRGALGAAAPVATAGLATVLAEYLFIGIGRSGQGVGNATAGRYAYVAVIVGLPAVAVLMSRLVQPAPGQPGTGRRRPGRERVVLPAALAVATALVCWNGCQLVSTELATRDSYGALIRGQYIAAQQLLAQGDSLASGPVLNARALSLRAPALVDVGSRDQLGAIRADPADVAAVRQRMQLVLAPLVPRAPAGDGHWLPDAVPTARVGDVDRLVHPRAGFRISAVHNASESTPADDGWRGPGTCVALTPNGAPFSVSLTPGGTATAAVVQATGTAWGELSWSGQVGATATAAAGSILLSNGVQDQLTMLTGKGRVSISSPVPLTLCGVTG